MIDKEVAETIKEYIRGENPANTGDLENSTNLLDQAWFEDSLSILNMVAFLEDHFGFSFERHAINARTFQSVENIAEYVLNRSRAG